SEIFAGRSISVDLDEPKVGRLFAGHWTTAKLQALSYATQDRGDRSGHGGPAFVAPPLTSPCYSRFSLASLAWHPSLQGQCPRWTARTSSGALRCLLRCIAARRRAYPPVNSRCAHHTSEYA